MLCAGYIINSSHAELGFSRKQRTDMGKYSFVNRSITDWNLLPEEAIETSHSKTHIFKTRGRKVKTSEGK